MASSSAWDKHKQFPYHLIELVEKGNAKKLNEELAKGNTSVNCQDFTGYLSPGKTALHVAASVGTIECLLLLLQYGADPNIQAHSETNTSGATALHYACHYLNLDCIHALLSRRQINAQIRASNGMTPKDQLRRLPPSSLKEEALLLFSLYEDSKLDPYVFVADPIEWIRSQPSSANFLEKLKPIVTSEIPLSATVRFQDFSLFVFQEREMLLCAPKAFCAEKDKLSFLSETLRVCRFNHENVVPFLSLERLESLPCFSVPLPLSTLKDLDENVPLSKKQNLAAQALSGLIYLAKEFHMIIPHFSSRFVFYYKDQSVRVHTFGPIQFLDERFKPRPDFSEFQLYLAPELSKGKPLSLKSAAYSFGIFFYEFLENQDCNVFDSESPLFDQLEVDDIALQTLLRKLLVERDAERLSLDQVTHEMETLVLSDKLKEWQDVEKEFEEKLSTHVKILSATHKLDIFHGDECIPLELVAKSGETLVFKSSRKSAAIKTINTAHAQPIELISLCDKLYDEVNLLTALKHPNVVKVIGLVYPLRTDISLAKGSASINMGYAMPYYNLSLKSAIEMRLFDSAEKIIHLFSRLVEVVLYLSEKSVYHRDLKPSNIMLDANLEPILIDFGIAMELRTPSTINNSQYLGTELYMAPERFENDIVSMTVSMGLAGEVYSLGIILYQLLTFEINPYRVRPQNDAAVGTPEVHQQVIQSVLAAGRRPTFPSNLSESSRILLCRMWDADPELRMNIREIMRSIADCDSKDFTPTPF